MAALVPWFALCQSAAYFPTVFTLITGSFLIASDALLTLSFIMKMNIFQMNFEFLKTLQGVINLLQVCLGFAALFAGFFIWWGKNLVFQFIFEGYGWQTLILFILFVTWLFAVMVFLSNLFDKDVLGQLGKMKLLILYAICAGLLIVSASLESWYCNLVSKDKNNGMAHVYKPRFIAVTVFNWILVATYLILIPLTMFFV